MLNDYRNVMIIEKKQKIIKCAKVTLIWIFSIIFIPAVSAATYYVSPSGSDTYTPAQAQNTNTPWKTIQRAADVMVAGDICLIKTGTYRETVTPANGGSSDNPITFQAYGDGYVIINGADSLPVSGQSWTLESSGIYYTPMNWTLEEGNQVFKNSEMCNEARWPNNSEIWPGSRPETPSSTTYTDTWSYLDNAGYDTNGKNGWLEDEALPAIDWTGCLVHILSGYGWLMMHREVVNYNNTTHRLHTDDNCGDIPAYALTTGNEYYITGNKSLLDYEDEWFYDITNSRLYFYSSSGIPSNIEVKSRLYGFDLCGKPYINLSNLIFFACTIKTDASSTDCTFNELSMKYLNHSNCNSSFWGIALRDRCVLKNSELAFDSRGLVQLLGSDIDIINNHLHDSGYVPCFTAAVEGIAGTCNFISHNTIHDSGRSLVGSVGKSMGICGIFEYNDLYNGMILTTDGAPFYTNGDAGNTIVRYNLIHDSNGPLGHNGAPINGFYLDCFNNNWIVHHNIIWNIPGYAIFINRRQNFNMIFNNTCWGTSDSLGSGFLFWDDGETGACVFNNLFPVPTSNIESDIRYNLYSDPLFIDPSNKDFRLQTSSPAIDAGIAITGITDNYFGEAPDIGALEYGGTDWTTMCGHDFSSPPTSTYNFPNMIFCNQVANSGFENADFSSWITSGSVDLIYQSSWSGTACTRSGFYSAKFSGDNSEIYQTVNNLQPDTRYILYVGIQKGNPTDNIQIGIRNYGRSSLETSASATDTDWHMYSLSFITGASSSSAQIYIVANSINTAAYMDDAAVLLSTPGRIGYWKMDNNATDSSDYEHSGAVGSGVSWTDGEINNAASFDGSSNASITLDNLELNTAAGGCNTVAFWMKWDGTQGKVPFSWNSYYNLFFNWDSFGINTGESNMLGISSSGLSNTWVHVVAVFPNGVPSPSNTKIYINGVEQTVTQLVGQTTINRSATSKAFIGAWTGGSTYNFAGCIDELQIFNRELTTEEIVKLASGQTGYWKLDGNAIDSAYGHSGAVGAGVSWTDGEINNAASFDGSSNASITLDNLELNTAAGGCNTVAFWMKWDGTQGKVPFSWNSYYNLFFNWDSFGINTGESNMLGISSSGLSNTWVHVVAIFPNGVPSPSNTKIYINGVEQTVTQLVGQTTINRSATSKAFIGAWTGGSTYNFAGCIDELQIFNRELSVEEIVKLASGQTGYWKLDGNAIDSAYGHSGTVGSGVSWTDGEINNAASFDGSSNASITLDNLELNTAAGGCNTVAFWMKWDGTQGKVPFSWNSYYNLFFNWDSFGINTGESNMLGISSSGLSNTWVHVVAVFPNGVPSPSNTKIYINGVEQTVTQLVGQTTINRSATSKAFIGAWTGGSTYNFAGCIDELQIFNRELTTEEISALFP